MSVKREEKSATFSCLQETQELFRSLFQSTEPPPPSPYCQLLGKFSCHSSPAARGLHPQEKRQQLEGFRGKGTGDEMSATRAATRAKRLEYLG